MSELCHRCHGELPAGNRQSSDEAMLFCPRCSAPQILLPEHMRKDPAGGVAGLTTGTTPPPRPDRADPRQIDWRIALGTAGAVALIAAALQVAGLKYAAVSLLWFFWLLAGANLAVSAYARQRPRAWMDARVGLRIGLVTGMLMFGTMSVASGAVGVVMRYGVHGLAKFDADNAEGTRAARETMHAWTQQNLDADSQKRYELWVNSRVMKSPEMQAGGVLFWAGFGGLMLMAISAGTGSLNGLMRGSKLSRDRRGL